MKLYALIFLFVFLSVEQAFSEQPLVFSGISNEKFVMATPLNENDHAKIKQILLTGIAISVNNIVNSNTTRTADGMEPYKYLYLEIHTDMSFEIKERKKSILLYNPTHPDTILRGEFSGYVDYPDIDVAREQSDIEAMLKLLETLPMGG